eukprot:TRINITY_DN5441_c0_g2_i3.p1 TRINITY_DN5441_c0_g2~~TRINITY_DN5441_c0_g2_i3.p1  ORF type:complete len:219 (+),score=78.37 TRINITY_DN5441_c0_g2_i3:152-808(+)
MDPTDDVLFTEAIRKKNLAAVKDFVEKKKTICPCAHYERNGDSPLHIAALEGGVRIVEYLLAQGCDANAPNKYGFTPMHRCAQSGDIASARILLEHGGDVNAATKYMDTPLHRAALHGHVHFVEFLLKHGAKIDAKDIVGRDAKYYAHRNGQKEIIEVLGEKEEHHHHHEANFMSLQLDSSQSLSSVSVDEIVPDIKESQQHDDLLLSVAQKEWSGNL